MSAAPSHLRVQGTIAVLTYQRPDDLALILPALFEQIAAVADDFDVLVVDNDAAGSAAPVLDRFAQAELRSVVEPVPGIAAARNRALSECSDRDLVVFIDDDESPGPDWLPRLLAQWRRSGATAVVGAVVSEFTGELDPWIRAGGFFDRRRLPTGTEVVVAASNNLLLDARQIRQLGLRFDEAFGLSGGSDTLFTREIIARGGSMVWCNDAVVTDRVPVGRMTRRWVLRRSLRMGNSWSRTQLVVLTGRQRGRARIQLLGQALARVGAGSLRALFGTLTRSTRHQANGARMMARGLGMLIGAVGYTYSEYGRPLIVAA